jgi:hypothetical protein
VAAVLHRVDPAQASLRASANLIVVTGNRAIGPRDPLAMASESRIRVTVSLLENASRIRVMASLLENASPGLETANQPTVNASRGRGMRSPAFGPRDLHVMASANLIPAMVSLLVNASPGRAMENLLMASVSRGRGMRSPAIGPRDLHVMASANPIPAMASPAPIAVAVIGRAETLKRIR